MFKTFMGTRGKYAAVSTLILLTCATPVAAVVPVLSGNYVFSRTENCGGGPGLTSGVLTFNTKKGTVSLTSFEAAGGNGPFSLQTLDGSTGFTNTATTLTYGGVTYQATYGVLDKKGVANNVSYIGITESGVCADMVSLSR